MTAIDDERIIVRIVKQSELPYSLDELKTIIEAEERFFEVVGDELGHDVEIDYVIDGTSFRGAQLKIEDKFVASVTIDSFITGVDDLLSGKRDVEEARELLNKSHEEAKDSAVSFETEPPQLEQINLQSINAGDSVVFANAEIADVNRPAVEVNMQFPFVTERLRGRVDMVEALATMKDLGFTDAQVESENVNGRPATFIDLNTDEIGGHTLVEAINQIQGADSAFIRIESSRMVSNLVDI